MSVVHRQRKRFLSGLHCASFFAPPRTEKLSRLFRHVNPIVLGPPGGGRNGARALVHIIPSFLLSSFFAASTDLLVRLDCIMAPPAPPMSCCPP